MRWIAWNRGFPTPVPSDCRVDVRLASGDTYTDVRAGDLDWGPSLGWANIVAYREAWQADEHNDDFQGSALIKQAVQS